MGSPACELYMKTNNVYGDFIAGTDAVGNETHTESAVEIHPC